MLPLLSRAALLRGALARPWSGCRRALGTHPRKEPIEALNTPQGARDFIYSLHPAERSTLLRELHRFESIAIAQEKLEAAPPSSGQLKHGFLILKMPILGAVSLALSALVDEEMYTTTKEPHLETEPEDALFPFHVV